MISDRYLQLLSARPKEGRKIFLVGCRLTTIMLSTFHAHPVSSRFRDSQFDEGVVAGARLDDL